MIEGAGRDRPRVKYTGWRGLLGLTRDPSAKEWATRDIPGYSAPMSVSSASKGDVIAVGHSGDAQGHVGIYVGGSGVASANWYQGGAITINNWASDPPVKTMKKAALLSSESGSVHNDQRPMDHVARRVSLWNRTCCVVTQTRS